MLLEKFGDEGDVLISYSSDSLNLLYPEQHAEVSCEICFFPFLLSFFFLMKFFSFLQNIIKNALHQIIRLTTLAGKAMIQIKFKMETS